MTDKKAVRRLVREQKKAMRHEEVLEKSEALGQLFSQTSEYKQAKSIYGYLPFNQEVRTQPILLRAMQEGKRVAVPKLYGNDMRFIWVEDLEQVSVNSFGCPEPLVDEPVADDAQALVLMPGVAFDAAGNRIGYGGGYYDRFLAEEPGHPTVALCFDFQLFSHLDTESHDVPVDRVIQV